MNTSTPTLVVDLDGTLIRTDLLLESSFAFLKQSPMGFFKLAASFLKGRLALKRFLAQQVSIDPQTLPYNDSVINFIKQQRVSGIHKIILASASHETFVKHIAEHIGFFDAYHGTSDVNLKGKEKLELIKKHYGSNVRYVGDSVADLPIWKALGGAYVVKPNRSLLKQLASSHIPTEVIHTNQPLLIKVILKALRPHQWAKNALILIPFLAAHKFFDFSSWAHAFMAFSAFSAMASCVYVMNDLADINSDRLHVEKRRRPFASGNLPLWWGAILIPVLLFVAFGISAFLPIGFGVTLLLYFFANILYSFKLKQVHSLDLILLAGMYTARLFAGGEATSSRITPWLAAFSIFFFVGLAAVKRFTEISKMLQRKVAGRGYYQDDKLVVLGIGIGSSLLSPLVLALYLNSPQVSNLYTHPTYLWILMPVLLFWIFRIWVAAGRGEVRSDPVLHAIKDKQSYLVALVSLLCIWMAI